MKKQLTYIILLTVGALLFGQQGVAQTPAQEKRLERAQILQGQLDFIGAERIFRQLDAKYPCYETASGLAECYRRIGLVDSAIIWYAKVVEFDQHAPEERLRFANTLRKAGYYPEAANWYEKYGEWMPEDPHIQALANGCRNIDQFSADTAAWTTWPLELNTPDPEFAPVPYDNGIAFVALRSKGKALQWSERGKGNEFTGLFFSRLIDETYQKPVQWGNTLNTKIHEGPFSFDRERDMIYYTRSTLDKKQKEEDLMGMHLGIFSAHLTKKKTWKFKEAFPYNQRGYSTAHPSLTADGSLMFFVSDMPGGFGGMDIYVSKRIGDEWGTPANLGPDVNTASHESFPFIFENGTLFFTSEGHPGLGGQDIYMSEFFQGKWQKVKNLGAPINSQADDFGFAMEDLGGQGFFSTDRNDAQEDLYRFLMRPEYNLEVLDSTTGEPLADAKVIVEDVAGIQQVVQPLSNGKYQFNMDFGREYTLIIQHPDYNEYRSGLNSKILNNATLHPKLMIPKDWSPETVENGPMVKIELFNEFWTPLDTVFVTPQEWHSPFSSTFSSSTDNLLITKAIHEFAGFVIVIKKGYFPVEMPARSLLDSKEDTVTYQFQLREISSQTPFKVVHHTFEQPEITQDDIHHIREVVMLMQQYPESAMRVVSHTDQRGTASLNLDLSAKRCNLVSQLLEMEGLRETRILLDAKGKSEPLVDCNEKTDCTEEDHLKNRRTEFYLLKDLKNE